jgi:hypothetical protein
MSPSTDATVDAAIGRRDVPMSADDLIGVWRLVEYFELDDTGATSEGPLGPDPQGLLMYGRDGHVAVSMMRTPHGPGPGWPDVPDGQETFMGYAGRWRLEGDGKVVHQVQVSAHPRQVGTEQVRDVVLDGDHLTLYGTRLTGDGRRMLRWRRVGPDEHLRPSSQPSQTSQAVRPGR